MLEMARAGLADVQGPDPHRTRPGWMNLCTYGRSVTQTIQTVKSIEPDFEEWWKPYQDWMASDPLMQFFNQARIEILHEGELKTSNFTVIGKEGFVDLGAVVRELNRKAPPGTITTFFGDPLGGNGWEVKMPNGSTQKVYFELPAELDIQSGIKPLKPPDEHDGSSIEDQSLANLGQIYLAALTRIVEEFIARFRD